MKVLFDYGNSFLAWAIRDGEKWITGKIDGQPTSTLADRLTASFAGAAKPEQVWIASVTETSASKYLEDWIERHWSLSPRMMHATDKAYGVTTSYQDAATLGSDRWAAMIAVSHRYKLPACIIDCGTAVTIDMLGAESHHLGGVISPGLGLLRNGLVKNIDHLKLNKRDAIQCLANSTSSGLLSGTLIGLAGAIEKIVHCQSKAIESELNIYLTGGDASEITEFLNLDVQIIDDLVLQGLDVVSEQES